MGRAPGSLIRALALASVSACVGTEPVGPPRVMARCTSAQADALTLTVNAAAEPTFSWAPACGVDWLRVEYPDPDYPTPPGESPPTVLAWARVGGLSPLMPPLRYGAATPGGFPEFFPPEPLVAGRTYTVRLLMNGAEPGSDVEVARAEFVP